MSRFKGRFYRKICINRYVSGPSVVTTISLGQGRSYLEANNLFSRLTFATFRCLVGYRREESGRTYFYSPVLIGLFCYWSVEILWKNKFLRENRQIHKKFGSLIFCKSKQRNYLHEVSLGFLDTRILDCIWPLHYCKLLLKVILSTFFSSPRMHSLTRSREKKTSFPR